MSKARKPVNKKKVLKIVLICLAAFVVINLIGAAIGTSWSITHPKLESYENRENYTKEGGMWGEYDSYDKSDYIVFGKDANTKATSSVRTGRWNVSRRWRESGFPRTSTTISWTESAPSRERS